MIKHTLPGHQTPHPHQRARCLKFRPPLPTIQINNWGDAEEAHCEGEESPLIELPNKNVVEGQRVKGRAISRFTNKIGKAFEC